MLTTLLLILVFAFVLLDWLAVIKGWPQVEVFAKPAVMAVLFLWLAVITRLQGPWLWFGLGLAFSLAGDVLLLPEDRFFLAGLIAFALAHMAYVIGFSSIYAPLNFWDLVLALVMLLAALRILNRLAAGLAAKNMRGLILPVRVYGLLISLMVFFALRTLSHTNWSAEASLLVSGGALLFYLSDLLLAWNKFVRALRNGRAWVMVTYHLGQIALITGVTLQFFNLTSQI